MINQKHFLIFIIALIVMSNFIVCGPPKTAEETGGCYPTDLNVLVDNGMMDVSWKNDCKSLISGYNIYINEEPLTEKYPAAEIPSSVEPHNTAPYSGDTNPEDGVEHYIAEHMENGKKYYVSVRMLYPDRTMSKPSAEQLVVCGPRGEIELSIRYKSNHDGYSFELDEYISADKLENDIYFFSKDGIDYLCSPVKLDGFLKANKLKKLNDKGEIEKVSKNLSALSMPDKDRVEIKEGDWLWLITPDKKSALIKVRDLIGNGEQRKIKLYFAYSPLSKEMIF